jgi:hypothetical protein
MSSLMPRRSLAHLRFSRDICPYSNVLDQAIACPNGALWSKLWLHSPLEVLDRVSIILEFLKRIEVQARHKLRH